MESTVAKRYGSGEGRRPRAIAGSNDNCASARLFELFSPMPME